MFLTMFQLSKNITQMLVFIDLFSTNHCFLYIEINLKKHSCLVELKENVLYFFIIIGHNSHNNWSD